MRNPEDLEVFRLADELTLGIYRLTAAFPPDERFGLTAQLRRAAVSVGSNIVEGCSRHSQADFARFIEIATGSAVELRYQLTLADRLDFGNHAQVVDSRRRAESCCKALIALGKSLRASRL